MNWASDEYLRGLSREWVGSNSTLTAEAEERAREDRVESGAANIESDVSAVHSALVNLGREVGSSVDGPAHLTAGDVTSVERAATASASRVRKVERARYLYWLLCRLGALGSITFTLPAEVIDRPPRALSFIADDPDLPMAARFREWQQHFASLALDTRFGARRGKPLASREREFRALAALLAFGGPCGKAALMDVARINRSDLLSGRNTLWLRDEIGNRTIELKLHPIQSLALAFYVRGSADTNYRKANGAGGGNRRALFPSLTTRSGRRAFGRWVAVQLSCSDSISDSGISAHCRAGLRLKSLLAGARRWMLDIYPVYLVSVLAGRFRATAISAESDESRGGRRRPIPEGQERVRKSLRREVRRFLATDTGIFSMRNVDDLCARWGMLIREPDEEGRTRHPASTQAWNLFLLVESLKRLLKGGHTNRYNTFERLFNTGCAVLNALGDRPAWSLEEDERAELTYDVAPSVVREVALHLGRVSLVAADYGLCARPEQAFKQDRRRSKRPRPRRVPKPEEIERLARHLLEQEGRPGRKKRVVPPRVVLLYFDLLALGLRKEEALLVEAKNIDCVEGAEETDLIVRGHKTPAARRRVPLEQHPHQASARRVIEVARTLQSEGRGDTPMLNAISGRRYRRYVRVGADDKTVAVAQLDRALARDGRHCGLHDLTPHELRHASITSWLLTEGAVPELIAKFHGQVDLPTTFQHYVHGLSLVQERELNVFLALGGNRVWVAAPDAIGILGISKQALYRRYPATSNAARESDEPATSGVVLRRPGRPRYIEAAALADHLSYRAPIIALYP